MILKVGVLVYQRETFENATNNSDFEESVTNGTSRTTGTAVSASFIYPK